MRVYGWRGRGAGILLRLHLLPVLLLSLPPLLLLPLFLEYFCVGGGIFRGTHAATSSSVITATAATAAADRIDRKRVRLRGEDVVALVKEVVLERTKPPVTKQGCQGRRSEEDI